MNRKSPDCAQVRVDTLLAFNNSFKITHFYYCVKWLNRIFYVMNQIFYVMNRTFYIFSLFLHI